MGVAWQFITELTHRLSRGNNLNLSTLLSGLAKRFVLSGKIPHARLVTLGFISWSDIFVLFVVINI